jgi:aspartyl-tRNA(Asn)/glutamyl-tRNA(Gln) amidotransferase subunit A
LKKSWHIVNDVEFEYLDYLVPTYYVLTTAEASSNLSRYDGVRYGHRSKEIESFNDFYHKTRTEGFGLEVKRRIMLGTFVLSSGYYDAYYSKAQKVRNKISKTITKMLEEYDYIVMPTTTDIAWEIGAFDKDPVSVYLSDVFTVLANLCGLPAISVPLGKDANGHSYGIQLISSKYNEANLLNAAFSFQNII